MSSEAPGHKTGKTVFLHSFCNHTESRQTHTLTTDTKPQQRLCTTHKRELEKSTKTKNKELKKENASYRDPLYYIALQYQQRMKIHAGFSLPLISNTVWYPVGILCQIFHWTIYPKNFSTQSFVGGKKWQTTLEMEISETVNLCINKGPIWDLKV